MAVSIGGLASGLDTATIIDQLMQLEAVPQTRLQSRVSSEQLVVTSLQQVNSKVASLATKAEALAKASAWDAVTAKSSSDAVTVSASSGATPTTLNVTVTGVAKTHQVGFTDTAALTDVVTGGSTLVTLDRYDGSPVIIDTGDGTLQGLVDAINDEANDTGLRATAVKVSDGSYQLLVESLATGADEDFTLTLDGGGTLLGGNTVRAGSNASASLGAGITLTSTTNTFSDVVDGVSISLASDAEVGDTATVTVARDTAGIAAQVKGLVDALNAVLSDIDLKSDSTSSTAPLRGDGTVRQLRNNLLSSVFPGGTTSLAAYGIQTTRSGRLELDEATFKEAFAADPTGTADMFTTDGNGFAARVAAVATTASDATDGTLTAAITGRSSGIDRMEDSIEEWDRRLALRRTTLERQFTALETAMSQMTSQSSWLAGQIASLPSSSS